MKIKTNRLNKTKQNKKANAWYHNQICSKSILWNSACSVKLIPFMEFAINVNFYGNFDLICF